MVNRGASLSQESPPPQYDHRALGIDILKGPRRKCFLTSGIPLYRGTSLIRNSGPLGPYSRTLPRALWWSYRGGAVS